MSQHVVAADRVKGLWEPAQLTRLTKASCLVREQTAKPLAAL